jgi:hypothetical protein
MGFDITDLGDSNRVVFVNFWNWRPTIEIIRAAGLLDAPRLESLQQQCSATRVSSDEARLIARHLRDTVLPSLPSESRVLLDGTSTTKPDDGTFHRSPDEFDRNYSASRSWLETFAAFCETCSGFEFN